MTRKIPKEHEDTMIEAYLSGATRTEAAALFGYSEKVCLNILKGRGITPRSLSESHFIPLAHENAMIAAYLAGASTRRAAELFGYSGQTCTNTLKRRGITPRSREEVCRRYYIDEHFFDYIDTEEKAYWLGFLTADGGIVRHQLILQLKISDIDHLHKFASSLHSEHPVSIIEAKGYGKVQPMARITVSSISLIRALSKLGVGENKSFTVRPCEYVPEWLLSAYWRGIFDGDGCISYWGMPKRYWEVSLVGNKAIVTGFHNFISPFLVSDAHIEPHKNIFRVRYSNLTSTMRIVKILYRDAAIYLDRKYKLARELCGEHL
jgi:hypothetical protein